MVENNELDHDDLYRAPLTHLAEADAEQELPWYKTSFPFVLLTFLLLNQLGIVSAVPAAIAAWVNLRHENWYRHRWPWFIVVVMVIASVAQAITQDFSGP